MRKRIKIRTFAEAREAERKLHVKVDGASEKRSQVPILATTTFARCGRTF